MKRIFHIILLFSLSWNGGHAYAEYQVSPEHKIKAALLYHFTKFIDWPENDKNKDIKICILGGEEFGHFLDSIHGKISKGKTMKVIYEAEVRLVECQVVFIGKSKHSQLEKIMAEIGRKSILTVSDMDRFLEKNGIIHLISRRKKIKFSINNRLARENSLLISSQLLNLAEKPE